MTQIAHIQTFKLSQLNPLKCHREDCVPNVLSYLSLLEREEAFKLANVTDEVLSTHVLNFLDDTYHKKHDVLEIYNTGMIKIHHQIWWQI